MDGKLSKNAIEDNRRIALRNAKRQGYTIGAIENYPPNTALKCYTDLPCRIEKGRDEFQSSKHWYVMFDSHLNINDKKFLMLHLL